MLSRRPLTLATWAIAFAVGVSVLFFWGRVDHAPLAPSRTGTALSTTTGTTPINDSGFGEPIVMTLVVIHEKTARESTVAIKSALMHASRPLHFHIVCSEDAIPILESKFALVQRPAYPVEVTYYTVDGYYIRDRSGRAGIGENYDLLVKVLLYELIDPTVAKAIFIDTDMIFAVDPLLLWKEFDKMTPAQLVAFPTNEPEGDPGTICSCVMLLKLGRMRDPRALFMPSTLLPATQKTSIGAQVFALAKQGTMLHKDGVWKPFSPMQPDFADQGIFHALWWYRRDLFMHLSLRWDVTNCRHRYGLTLGRFGDDGGADVTEAEQLGQQWFYEKSPEAGKLLVPGILHFNCQNDDNVWEVEKFHSENPFGPLLTVAQRYKWIWLNRGDGSAGVKTVRWPHVRWWDEKLAERAGSPDGGQVAR